MPTFKAMLATQQDGEFAISIEQIDTAQLPPGEVLIRVAYSDLNYKDGCVVTGRPGFIRKYPMVPGIDLAGTVEESASPECKPGDKVVVTGWGLSESMWGGYAELARLDAKYLVPVPPALSLRQAAAIGTAGFTAMQCVLALERHGVLPGSSKPVLVTGAAGGVGSLAVAILAKLGYTVAASTGRAELGDYLRSLGAHEIVDRASIAAPSKKPIESERWAGAVDSVGGDTLSGVLRAIANNGCVAACGLAGGAELHTTVVPFILRGVVLAGINSVYVPKPERVVIWDRLAKDLPLALLDSTIQESRLEDVFDLSRQILAGKVRGRAVIRISN